MRASGRGAIAASPEPSRWESNLGAHRPCSRAGWRGASAMLGRRLEGRLSTARGLRDRRRSFFPRPLPQRGKAKSAISGRLLDRGAMKRWMINDHPPMKEGRRRRRKRTQRMRCCIAAAKDSGARPVCSGVRSKTISHPAPVNSVEHM